MRSAHDDDAAVSRAGIQGVGTYSFTTPLCMCLCMVSMHDMVNRGMRTSVMMLIHGCQRKRGRCGSGIWHDGVKHCFDGDGSPHEVDRLPLMNIPSGHHVVPRPSSDTLVIVLLSFQRHDHRKDAKVMILANAVLCSTDVSLPLLLFLSS